MEISTETLTGIGAFLTVIAGLVWKIYSMKEDNRAKRIENDKTANENLSSQIETQTSMNKTYEEVLATMRNEIEYLKQSRKELHERLDRKDEVISQLRKDKDELNSAVAVLTSQKCTLLHCTNRRPPININDTTVG